MPPPSSSDTRATRTSPATWAGRGTGAWPTRRSFLAFSAEEWARAGAGPYLIRSRLDGQLLGGTGVHMDHAGVAMTGYVLAKDAWGMGYATEVLRAMIDVARGIGVGRLYALCHPDHRPSWHVLEKGGFTLDPAWTRQVEFPNLAPGVLQYVRCYALRL